LIFFFLINRFKCHFGNQTKGQRYNESDRNYFTREALDSVEIFDLKSREWSLGKKMPSSLYNNGVCVYDNDSKCIYLCGTTECKYSGNTLFGFMFTSVFRLEFSDDVNNETKMKWTVVEHDVSDIKSNYRCLAAKLNTRKLHKCSTDIEPLPTSSTASTSISNNDE
jgi:hypothetical protein